MQKDYKKKLDKEKNDKYSNSALENAKEFLKIHKAVCNKAYKTYSKFKNNINDYLEYNSISSPECIQYQEKKVILIVTANDIEKSIFLYHMSIHFNKKITVYTCDETTFAGISVDNYLILHTHTTNTGDEYARRAINEINELFNIDFVILLGICFGINHTKNSLGQVLISTNIKGYSINFRDSDDGNDIIFEPVVHFDENANKSLIKSLIQYNSYHCFNNSLFNYNFNIDIGTILSANSLFSSKIVKNEIVSAFGSTKPRALGGEMEATGIFKSNFHKQNSNNWIVIKAICDWGEDKNHLDEDEETNSQLKDQLQSLAMANSTSIFITIIENNWLGR